MTTSKQISIDVDSHGETFHLEGHPCSLSAFSYVPRSRNLPRERTYFNSPKKSHKKTCVYDLVFSKEDDFNPKLHRSDRRHDKHSGLNINDEEKVKSVPSLSSSMYGHRLDKNIEISDRKHARIMLVESEFFRRNGIDI
ncbi:unnamed protein product [Heterobilharzia americana]|nr:unnamed protein product [Heterobilharzia americana]